MRLLDASHETLVRFEAIGSRNQGYGLQVEDGFWVQANGLGNESKVRVEVKCPVYNVRLLGTGLGSWVQVEALGYELRILGTMLGF